MNKIIKCITPLIFGLIFCLLNCKKDNKTTQKDTTAPMVQFTSPILQDSGTIVRNSVFVVNAVAANKKSIVKVEFYINGILMPNGIDSVYPYQNSFECTDSFGLNRRITAIAYDNEGDTSSAIMIVRFFNGIEKTPMPTSRYAFTCNVVNGIIYVIGGDDFHFFTNEAYDPATDTWTTKTGPTIGRSEQASCVVNGLIYVFGGGTDVSWDSSVEAYDPTMDMWTTKAWIPYDSFASIGMNAAALGANGNVYLMGGLVNPDPARVAEYNPITNSWRMMNSYKMQYSARAVTLNNQIYFMGGCPFRSMGDCDNPSDSFQIYDPVLDAWEDQPPMLYAHTGHAVTVYNNKVYVMGGTPMSSPLPNKTFEVFDPLTGKWTLLPPLPEAMINFGCCAVGNKIYIIGQNHMYEYTPD